MQHCALVTQDLRPPHLTSALSFSGNALGGGRGIPWPQIVALIGSLCWKFHLKSFTSETRGAQEAGRPGGARARGPQAGLGWIPQRLCRDWPHPGPGGRNLGAPKSGRWSAQPRLLARTWLSPPPGAQSGVSSTLGRLRGSQTPRQKQSASGKWPITPTPKLAARPAQASGCRLRGRAAGADVGLRPQQSLTS